MLILAATVTATDLTAHLNALDQELTDMYAQVQSGFKEDTATPRSGMVVSSRTQPGEDALHALIVLRVFRGEPADVAGIKAGDRILFIGKRHIEHETTEIAYTLLDGTAGPLSVTISREQKTYSIQIIRAPLRCAQNAVEKFDRAKWLRRITILRECTTDLNSAVQKYPNDQEKLEVVLSELIRIRRLLPIFINSMQLDFKDDVWTACPGNDE